MAKSYTRTSASTSSTNNADREIGIRRVLGVSIADIVSLISNDYVRILLFAFIASTPLSVLFAGTWLSSLRITLNFPGRSYRAGMSTLICHAAPGSYAISNLIAG